MTGKLKEHPLAELIREVISEKLSGLLRLEHERVKTAIYFDRGDLIYATSNLRPHRLAESLRRWRVVTDGQLASLSLEGKNDLEVGRALVAQGLLTEEALMELRARLAADVLRPALLWTEGAWSFDPRVRLAEDIHVSIELPELLMEAARRFPKTLAASRFPNTNEKINPLPDTANNLDLLPAEAFVLTRIYSALRLHELLAISGLPEEETLHACYVLALGGFIARESWPRAFTPEEVAKALKAGAAAAAGITTQTAGAPEAKKEETKAEPIVDEKRELEELFERVGRATSHYQVLGLARNVDQDEIKRTYHRLARRYHPDRFHQNAALHSRVEEAFAKIAQAYETLKDRSTRATYDLKLDRGKDEQSPGVAPKAPQPSHTVRTQPTTQAAQPSASQRSEESFQKGLMALKMGGAAHALAFFAEAARLSPTEARYRAQYGRVLAGNVQMRHRAETEFQEAIMLEPNNIAYRIMLAKLYQDLDLPKRAQGELERALQIDSRNAEAQQLLTELQSKQGVR